MSSQAASSYSVAGFQGPSSDLTGQEKETCHWNQRNSLSTKQTEEHRSLGTHNCLPRLGGEDQFHLDWNTDHRAKEFGGECGLLLSGALMFHTFKKTWCLSFPCINASKKTQSYDTKTLTPYILHEVMIADNTATFLQKSKKQPLQRYVTFSLPRGSSPFPFFLYILTLTIYFPMWINPNLYLTLLVAPINKGFIQRSTTLFSLLLLFKSSL